MNYDLCIFHFIIRIIFVSLLAMLRVLLFICSSKLYLINFIFDKKFSSIVLGVRYKYIGVVACVFVRVCVWWSSTNLFSIEWFSILSSATTKKKSNIETPASFTFIHPNNVKFKTFASASLRSVEKLCSAWGYLDGWVFRYPRAPAHVCYQSSDTGH